MSDSQSQVVQLFRAPSHTPGAILTAVRESFDGGYRHRPNRDLSGVLEGKRDAYSAIAYSHRLIFLLDADINWRTGREIYNIFPIRFEEVHFDDGQIVVDEVLYDSHVDPRFYIARSHVLGRGGLWDAPERLPEEMVDAHEDMTKVLQAAIAYHVQTQ